MVERWRDHWLNVHPALLPSFPGTHAVADALDAGVKVTGVTVHLVDVPDQAASYEFYSVGLLQRAAGG